MKIESNEYTRRLLRKQNTWWKRLFDVQAAYRYNLVRLKPGRTLDIGCGIGRNLLHLQGNGVGIDVNPHSVNVTRSRGLIAYTPEDFFRSPHAVPRTFDTLLLAHVAEHMTRSEVVACLKTYLPYLRVPGQIILITPQEYGFRRDPTHVEFMDFDTLEAVIADLDLVPSNSYSFPFPRVFGRVFAYNEFIVVGRLGDASRNRIKEDTTELNRTIMPSSHVSIILLTLNGGRLFARTLHAVFSQELKGHLRQPPEVIVIDSGSSDDTLDTARRYPVTIHTIRPDEFGHGRTRNLGARLAHGEWLVYLSQDAVPASPSWLHNLTRHLQQPDVAAAFGRQLPPAGLGPIETYFLEQTYPDRPFQHKPTSDERTAIRRIFFSNVNSVLKKPVLECHPFPEDVVMSEDQAFARAALMAGYKIVYDPEAAVLHGHRYTLGQLFRRNFDSGYSLRGITEDGWTDVARMGLNYVLDEMRFLVRSGYWPYVPYAFVYELVKAIGFATGRNGRRLPAWLVPHLSLHARYWSDRRS